MKVNYLTQVALHLNHNILHTHKTQPSPHITAPSINGHQKHKKSSTTRHIRSKGTSICDVRKIFSFWCVTALVFETSLPLPLWPWTLPLNICRLPQFTFLPHHGLDDTSTNNSWLILKPCIHSHISLPASASTLRIMKRFPGESMRIMKRFPGESMRIMKR